MTHLRTIVAVAVLGLVLATGAWADDGKRCPSCGRSYAASATFCLDDGTRLVAAAERCPKCGTERVGATRFCGSCGYSFAPPRQPETAPQPRPPAERICPQCGRKPNPGMKFCAGCGTTLPAETVAGADPGAGYEAAPGDRQWASEVVAYSSQMGPGNFSARQIAGPPDVVRGGKDGKAWAPNLGRRGEEWVTVRFARPMVPGAVRIYETAATGFVVRIHVIDAGREVLFWEAEDRANAEARILEAASTVETGPVDTIKITVDTKKVRQWTEIDAVELIAAATAGRRQGTDRVPPRPPAVPRAPQPGDPGYAPAPERPTGGVEESFDTPDACYQGWKRAILARDAAALAPCYVLLERVTIEQEPDVAQAVFARYAEGLRRGDDVVESRRSDVGGQIWTVEMSVRDGAMSHRVRETFRFRREAGSWRMQVERGG